MKAKHALGAALLALCLVPLLSVPLMSAAAPGSGEYRKMIVYLRGKPQALRIYDPPPGAPRRHVQVLVTSGDLGFIELSETVPLHLQREGYRVIGLDARAYIAAYTGDEGAHLEASQIPRDYQVIMEAASVDTQFPERFVSIGVSEGAGLAIMAMGQEGASPLCDGVIGLGLPILTALGWRWTDLITEVTRREPHEALADNHEYVERLHVPLVVAHSKHDEYDAVEKVQEMVEAAPGPKRFYAVDAPNHRFSHHSRDIFAIVDGALSWIQSMRESTAQGGR